MDSTSKASKLVKARSANLERELRRQAELRRMIHHIPYFKLRSKINEFTGR